MKKLLVITLISSFFFVSCNKKSEEIKSESKTGVPAVSEAQRPPDSVLILGIWQRTNKKMWMEFRSDGTFDIGKDKIVKDSNRHWHIDTAKKALFLDFSNGAKFIPYNVNNSRLHLDFKDRGKQIDMVRIGVSPDVQP